MLEPNIDRLYHELGAGAAISAVVRREFYLAELRSRFLALPNGRQIYQGLDRVTEIPRISSGYLPETAQQKWYSDIAVSTHVREFRCDLAERGRRVVAGCIEGLCEHKLSQMSRRVEMLESSRLRRRIGAAIAALS
jgi:hypothetical protein